MTFDSSIIAIPDLAPLASARELYLDLMKRGLINHLYQDRARSWGTDNMDAPYDPLERSYGEDHPHSAHTMVGWKRLTNIQECFAQIVENQIPGDLIETGVWRGGSVIFMRALLAAYKEDRRIWVADSFQGVPKGNLEQDRWSNLHELTHLEVSMSEVKENFRRYGLLDNRVVFLDGWFQETLPKANLPKFSLIRLDGDLYESTQTALVNLYPRLSVGGFAIIDDYFSFTACRSATDEYRLTNNIESPLVRIDRNSVYWQKCDE